MIDLAIRSYQKELLDLGEIPFADIRQNMKELNTINTYLGGHRISISGVNKILKDFNAGRPVVICEIGCGGGDNLNAIEKWCRANDIKASFIGIDIKPECIEFARSQYPGLDARWVASDYKDACFDTGLPDIIFSSLFCHHFANEAITRMLEWMKDNARIGFFINDLHRHPLAYYSIKLITRVFSKSYLVKNDAPLSVARGFSKKEWQQLAGRAGLTGCEVQWKWAFRHLVVYISPGRN